MERRATEKKLVADWAAGRGAPPVAVSQLTPGSEESPAQVEMIEYDGPKQVRPPLPPEALEPPREEYIQALVKAGTVVVCQVHGPHQMQYYHTNFSGMHGGCVNGKEWKKWMEANRLAIAATRNWGTLDLNDVEDMDWLLAHGRLRKKAMDFAMLRPLLQRLQATMRSE